GISIDNELMTANLFQLSTGQAVLLDLFLAIIRDFDLSHSLLTQLSDIEGIVVVDEIDLHLHTDLQHDLLPKLIRLFPKVQFMLTTHSPLFLIGMEKVFTSDGFQLIELPDGQEIEVERFSEFEAAYKHMQDSVRFQDDIRKRIEADQKPILFLEGTTDIDYLTKAGELLGKAELLNKFEMVDAVGSPHLNKIWDTYKLHLGATIKKKWLLLYDCDAGKLDSNKGNLFRRTIAQQPNKIESGIENLFSDKTIQRAIDYKRAFVDIKEQHILVERGVEKSIPETWKINKDEKRNLCDWICENATADDFRNFSLVFDILEEVLAAQIG
ncbi:MAG: AAA family ATPase, partial [Pseudomonadales bacterium]